jgi:tetratricopeptide (TPR) repeat protein
MPDMKLRTAALTLLTVMMAAAAYGQQTGGTGLGGLLDQARKLEDDGRRNDALAGYRQILDKDPGNVGAQLGIGRVLDIEGQYAEARRHLQKAIDTASDQEMNQALSTMAVSYAFEGRAGDAATYYQKIFDRQIKAGAPESAGGTANALGRVYLETGDVANAEKWYRTGYEIATKGDAITPAQKDLAEMRWHHAQARIAARRGQPDAARKHADEVRAVVGRGTLEESQTIQYPYVEGYVAFYQRDYERAIAELSKANQDDPFILSLLAQAYEQKKDHAKARDLYSKIVALPDHSLQAALARPMAERRLAGK